MGSLLEALMWLKRKLGQKIPPASVQQKFANRFARVADVRELGTRLVNCFPKIRNNKRV